MSYLQASPGSGETFSPFTSITGTPTEIAYFDAAGNGTSDNELTRDSVTHESVFGFQTYASGTVNDNVSLYVDWRADNVGSGGNAITFTFDGIIDTDTALANWNAANPSNTASVVGGTGNFVPPAGTVTFRGGGNSGYELSHNSLGQGIQLVGSIFTDNATQVSLNGLLNTGDGVNPFLIALDFATNDQSSVQVNVDGIDLRSNNATDDAVIRLQANQSAKLQFNSQINGNAGIEASSDANLRLTANSNTWLWTRVDGTNGDVLTTDGAGNLSFTTPLPALKENYIGFGNSSNILTGSDSLKYHPGKYSFKQTFPNNTNNGITLGAALSFGTAIFTGPGVNDLILNWDASIYKSKKYGGNLTIQVTSTGTSDTITWIYTGTYSEIIGQGTIALTPGVINLSDINGDTIAQIQFGSTTGHIGGEQWTAGTSLGNKGYGTTIADTNHAFFILSANIGEYIFGDTNPTAGLGGNGTRIQITDQIAELGLFANGSFAVRNTLGADIFKVNVAGSLITAGDTAFPTLSLDLLNRTATVGDVLSAANGTKVTVDDITQLITVTNVPAYADDSAATTAGLTTGQLYKTTTLGSTLLKIVP